jgi:hypothetical protein
MARLTQKQKAQKNLEIAKAREEAKGVKPKFINQGVNGQKITGKKHWG